MADGLTLAAGAVALALAALLTPGVSAVLLEKGICAGNYRGVLLAPAGLALPAALLPASLPLLALSPHREEVLLALVVLALAGWGGFVDDVAGRHDPKGLLGHAGALRAGRVTAGSLKAAFLLAAGAVAEAGLAEQGALPVAALVPLAAQAVNCLDLRPGRAGKAFLAGLAVLAAAAVAGARTLPAFAYPLAGAVAGFLPWDLRERCLLGDTGANLLGAGLGLAMAAVLPVPAQWVAVVLLVLFIGFCDRVSLTRVMEGLPPRLRR